MRRSGHGEGRVIIPANVYPWPHELRVAQVLAAAGHVVGFLPTRSTKTADVLVDGAEFEIKSPKTANTNSLEHIIKKGLRQSANLIIDSSRLKGACDIRICQFLVSQVRKRRQIKKKYFVTRSNKIIDTLELI